MSLSGWARAADDPIVAQTRVEVGDGTVDGSRIEPYENLWRYFAIDGEGREIPFGTWHDVLTVDQFEGIPVFRRIQTVDAHEGPDSVQVDIVDRKTLAPYHVTIAYDGAAPSLDLRFDGARIYGKRPVLPDQSAQMVPSKIDMSLDRPVFDWHLWGLLIAGFPLEHKYSAEFLAHAFIPGQPSLLTDVRFAVRGSEMVEGRQGKIRDCWIVDVEAGVPWRIWIAKRGTAPVVQIHIDTPDGWQRWWKPADVD